MLGLVVSSCGAGIAEVQKHVDLVVGDTGRNLLLAALLARQELFDGQAGGLRDVLCRNAGSAEIMLTQNSTIRNTKLCHEFFF